MRHSRPTPHHCSPQRRQTALMPAKIQIQYQHFYSNESAPCLVLSINYSVNPKTRHQHHPIPKPPPQPKNKSSLHPPPKPLLAKARRTAAKPQNPARKKPLANLRPTNLRPTNLRPTNLRPTNLPNPNRQPNPTAQMKKSSLHLPLNPKWTASLRKI